MDEDRVYGTSRNLGGKVEEGVGRLTGDKQTQVKGKLDQLAGTAQDLYGQTTDPHETRLGTSTNGYARRSRPSPIQRQSWRSVSAGSSAECAGRSDRREK